MARISYFDPNAGDTTALVSRIKAERGELPHLYAMLLNSPPMAEGWLTLLTAVRQKGRLPGDLREMVIMQVAHLNGAPYEAEQHRHIALREGLSEAQVDSLGDWRSASVYNARQRAVLAYCEQMTRNIHVDDKVFADALQYFDAQLMLELTLTISAYNMVSRLLEALQIASNDHLDT